jgi:hypothetical protein
MLADPPTNTATETSATFSTQTNYTYKDNESYNKAKLVLGNIGTPAEKPSISFAWIENKARNESHMVTGHVADDHVDKFIQSFFE